MTDHQQDKSGQKQLLQYAGFATQLVVSLGLGVLAGHWVDKKFAWPVPVFTWLLPLLILVILFVKVAKDTSRK